MSRSGIEIEKAYQDLFRFCWSRGGFHSFEEAMIQWDMQGKFNLSTAKVDKLKRRCEWLGLPSPQN